MSEQPKNPHSQPPPPTDEIDAEWSESQAAKGAAASTDDKSASKLREHEEEEDDENDDDDDDDDDEEEEEDDGDDDDDDDDDEEEEEDDDDDEDDHKGAHSKSTRPAQSESGADEMIPDGGPWAVLGVLVLIGLVGGLGGLNGLIQIEKPRADEPAPEPTPSVAAAPARTVAKPLASARAAAAMDPKDQETVEASHLLVSYKGSRRAQPTVTRTKEEAKKRAEEALAKAKKKNADFAKVVAEYSDEPRAAERGGKLGSFTRRRMAKEFSDAAFALKPGELSGVVESPFGYHVILRTK